MTITEVLGRLAATADARAYVFGPDDSSSLAALEMREAVADLWTAARLTLEENAHLADGDQCTLKRLRDAVIEAGGLTLPPDDDSLRPVRVTKG